MLFVGLRNGLGLVSVESLMAAAAVDDEDREVPLDDGVVLDGRIGSGFGAIF